MKQNGDITTSSKISLPLAITLVTAAVGISAMFASIKSDLAELRRHVTSDWTLRDMVLWTSYLNRLNGTNLSVPDADNIWKRGNP